MSTSAASEPGVPLCRQIELLPGPHALVQLLDHAAAFCDAAGFDALGRSQVQLVLEELVVNALAHGGAPEGVPIHVSLRYAAPELCIHIRDQGAAFDPTVPRNALADVPLSEQAIGGLGLFLTQQLADEMVHERIDGVNHLTLRKRMALKGWT